MSGEKCITENMKSSSKTLKLLQYLITYRHKTISKEKLLEIFCEGDQMGDPASALRMMVSRARTTLENNGLSCAKDIILFKNGCYLWNNSAQCDIDVEEFEALCKRAGSEIGADERLELLLWAIELYRGDFLPNSADEMWVIPLARWYRSMYLDCVHNALELLTKKGQSGRAEELCVKALRIEPFDEELLGYHLRTLLAQGKNTEALEIYKRSETMFYDVLGTEFSENLRALYKQIHHPAIKEDVTLDTLLNEWLEDADLPGAFYCDLSVFKTLYQIEPRSILRSGQTAYIVRIDTKHEPNIRGGGVMKHLGTAISDNLRKGDLFTRSSPSQYMLMLHNLTYEDCKSLISRIMYALDAKYLPKIIGTSIKAVTPIK